jgi:hypothetical protein
MRIAVPLLVVLLAGCGSGAATRPARGFSPAPLVVDCTQRVETPRSWPPRGWRRDAVFAGPVAFFGLHSYANQEPMREGGIGTETPLLVPARRQVTVVVRTPGVHLLWGDFEGGRRAVTFKACPSWQRSLTGHGEVGRVTQFLGGFGADRPRCVAIHVYVFGRERPYKRRFALGHPCG